MRTTRATTTLDRRDGDRSECWGQLTPVHRYRGSDGTIDGDNGCNDGRLDVGETWQLHRGSIRHDAA